LRKRRRKSNVAGLCSAGDDAGQLTESTAAKMSDTSLRVV
jgi:hypothetical protein